MVDGSLETPAKKVNNGYRYFYKCRSCGRERGMFTDYETFQVEVESHTKQHRGHVLQLWMSWDNGDFIALGEVWEPTLIQEITGGR